MREQQRFFAIRDTSDVEKNLANQVTDFVWNIWQKDNRDEVKPKYFFSESKQKFLLAPGTQSREDISDDLYIIPPTADVWNFLNDGTPAYHLPVQDIIDCMDSEEAVFIIAPDLNEHINGADLHRKLCTAVIDRESGDFLDYKTREPVSHDKPSSRVALFAAIFRMGTLPVYVMLTNSDFVENKCWDEYQGTAVTYISVLKESRSVKDEIFSPAYRKGFVSQVGKNDMFVSGDEFQIEMFGEYLVEIPSVGKAVYEDSMIYPYKNQIMDMQDQVHAYSNWPTRVDEEGRVFVDMSNAEVGDTGYLKVEIEGGEFFKYWIYKVHRTIYEYVLHKVDPIDDQNDQGTIHSPGFF